MDNNLAQPVTMNTPDVYMEVASQVIGKSLMDSLQYLNENALLLKVYKRDGDVKHVYPIRSNAVYCVVENDIVTDVISPAIVEYKY